MQRLSSLPLPASMSASLLALVLAGSQAHADLPADTIGQTTLPFPPEPHRTYVIDAEFENQVASRVIVVDPDSKKMLGMLSTGGMAPAVLSNDRKTIFTADMFYSRYTRGTRTDVLTAWDSSTLEPAWEVEVPPKRASMLTQRYAVATSADDRFAYVYNFTPSTSITIVDTTSHKVVNELSIAGCVLDYPVGKRRIASLCGDGNVQVVTLDDQGQEVSRSQTPFFKPDEEKLVERAVGVGDIYRFVTTTGTVHGIDLSGKEPKVLPSWSLLSDEDKKGGWAPGGWELMAIAPKLNRLYVLMHPDHQPQMWEDPSQTIWVYDLKTHKKIGTLESPSYVWSLHATSDDHPLLLGTNIDGGLEIFDLTSGKHTGTMEKLAKTPIQILNH
ncbi:amine dehydrogenase [Pokkaliibacter plantistimulans]|uniref:Amine dehydrogenase n=1 Tax=Proteobacteria bacterium 228 TaxID=2083153 RepID=A0A2S5KIC4_9PROT|nr:amine dehydrogenase large subunit [Pokkaliibacter plantistimulans]PPC74259.1 amine dehydrogenase [Pokkaliibacter plantistimulans]